MRKVLVAALVCVASSFAGWDYFPVIEYGKGEAKLGYTQSRQGKLDSNDFSGFDTFKIRYSPMANLELMSKMGYTFGARYQLFPVISLGVDVGFPISETRWNFTPNIQFSTLLTEVLSLGSNVQLTGYTKDDKYSQGLDLSAGVELDLAIGKSLVWLSCDLNTGLTSSKRDGKEIMRKKENRGLEIAPALGYVAGVGNLSLGTNAGMAFGEDAGHDNFSTFIGLDFSIKF